MRYICALCLLVPSMATAQGFDPSNKHLRTSPQTYQLTPQEQAATRNAGQKNDGKEPPRVMLDKRYVDQVRQLPPDLQEAEFDYITKNPDYRRQHQLGNAPKVVRLQKPNQPQTTEPTIIQTPSREETRWEKADDRLRERGDKARQSAFETMADPEVSPSLVDRRARDRLSSFSEGALPLDLQLREKMRAASPRLNAFERPADDATTTTNAFTRGRDWQDPAPNNIARKMNEAPAFNRDDDRVNAFSREREYESGQPSYVDPQPVTLRPFDGSVEGR